MTQTKAELLQTRHQGDIRLGDADSTHYVGFKAPATVSSSLVWTLPAADGTANYLLKTDGSGNLSWTADNSGVSLSGSTNNTIATVTGANALQGENDLTFDGNTLTHTVAANSHRIQSLAAGNHYTELRFDSNRSSAADTLSVVDFRWDGTTVVDILAIAGDDTTNKDDGILAFRTSASAGGIAERMRILSSGKVGIGDTAPDALLSIKGDSNGDSNPSIRLKDGSDTRECWMSNVSGDLYLATGGNDNAFHTRIRLMDGNAIYMETGGTLALSLDSSQNTTFASAIYGPVKTVSALELDLSTGNYFIKTISGNSTFTFANPAASGTVTAFTLELTHSSGTVTWPSSVKWNADTAPTLTTGKTHLFMFVTDDGGTRYRGSALVDYVN